MGLRGWKAFAALTTIAECIENGSMCGENINHMSELPEMLARGMRKLVTGFEQWSAADKDMIDVQWLNKRREAVLKWAVMPKKAPVDFVQTVMSLKHAHEA